MTDEEIRKYIAEAASQAAEAAAGKAAKAAAQETTEAAKETREAVRELNIMVADLKSGVSELAAGQAKIEVRLDQMQRDSKAVSEQYSHVAQKLSRVEAGQEQIIDALQGVRVELIAKQDHLAGTVEEHETRIAALEAKAQ